MSAGIGHMRPARPVSGRRPGRDLVALRRALAAVVAAAVLHLPLSARAGAQAPGTPEREEAPTVGLDRVIRTFLLAELLEYAPRGAADPIRFEGLGWIGGDYNRVWLRADGEQATAEGDGEIQAEVLYGRLVSPFWSVVTGVGVDARYGGGDRAARALLALGFQGLAPYWFEMEPTLFVSQRGDVSAQFETSFDVLFTQRLIVQPRLELSGAVQAVPEFGIGSGLNDVELGARMRYEIRREFAPYVGVSWVRRVAGTADLAQRAGEAVSDAVFVAGLRLWR